MLMKKSLRQFGFAVGAVVAQLTCVAGSAVAQNFPTRPIEIVVPYAAGGSTDALGRAFADASRNHSPEPVVVVNKPGAGGSIGANDIINSKADGYKIGLFTNDVLTTPLLGLAKFSYMDIEPIAQLNFDPVSIIVRSDAPWKTVGEFLTAAKNTPDGLRIGTTGNGTLSHLAAAALVDKTGAKLAPIPFQGASPAILSLLGGHIEAVTATPPEVMSHVQAGTLRIILVLADQRSKAAVDAPTARESGIDLSVVSWRYLGVSKKTPPDIIAKLRQIAADTAKDPAMIASLEKQNIGYRFVDGQEFQGVLDKEYGVMKDLITKINMSMQGRYPKLHQRPQVEH
jgi:tripartite-type tricarboxylate transporter receptor subunit TctC